MHFIDSETSLPREREALIEIRDLDFSYPDGHQALRQVNLTIRPGDRIALVGQNGSGKSTLAHHLNGLLEAQAGTVIYKGQPLRGEHLRRARLEVGLLFQDPDDQLFCNTLLEDVAFGPGNQGLSAEQCAQRARDALAQVGLADLAYKPSHHLSYGQKKRGALATLLAMRPQVLILDEPTANLDPAQDNILRELLRAYEGTLICITHDLLFAYDLCQRAVVLDQGRVHHDYTLRELVSHAESLREHGLDFSFRLDGIDDILAAEATRREPLLPETDDPAVLSKPEASPLVAVKDYSFSYPDGTQALRKIHFKINRGESVAIVGENGAGKTTLLHCLLGILEGRGEHLFEGIPINRRRRRNLWRRIGIIFQDPADQLFCPTCAEEVAFGPRQMGVKKEALAQRVYQALTQVHLQGYEDRIPQHLSGGERKRLAIATVLAMQPDILILDEPTAGLDPQGEELLLNILQGLPQTRILVSHDPYLTAKLTQRTVVLHQGEIVRDYSTHEFLHDQDRARLNLLTLTSRREHCREIRALQHQHAHSHRHRHLHEHRHRHGDLEHSHPHEHEHNHAHTYIHLHGADTEAHCHPPRPRYHDHAHPHHEQEPHDHDHPEDH